SAARWLSRRWCRCCGRRGSWWSSRRWRSGCSAAPREWDHSHPQGEPGHLVPAHPAAASVVAVELPFPERGPGLGGDPYVVVVDDRGHAPDRLGAAERRRRVLRPARRQRHGGAGDHGDADELRVAPLGGLLEREREQPPRLREVSFLYGEQAARGVDRRHHLAGHSPGG